MSAEAVPLPRRVRSTDTASFARSQRSSFTNQNMHIGRSSVVHAVSWGQWIDELKLPIPACHQGFSGVGAPGQLLPTRWPVTCRRCRRLRGDDPDADTLTQPALFAL